MGRIKNKVVYPLKTNPVPEDYLVGSDSEDNGKTVNFTVEAISGDTNTVADNNKTVLIDFGNAETLVDDERDAVALAIDASPAITIAYDEIPIFKGIVSYTNGNPVASYLCSFTIQGRGKGDYGIGGISVTGSNLIRVSRELVSEFPDLSGDVNAVVVDLGDIGTNQLEDVVNVSNPPIVVGVGENYYFEYNRSGARFLYGFSGTVGTYGLGESQTVADDYFLVYDEAIPTTVTKTSQLINDGDSGDSSFVEFDVLADVAISGDYEDLINTPVFKVVENEYANMAAMYADQGSQTNTFIQYVSDASAHPDVTSGDAYFEYLGTTNGDDTDYRLLSDEESAPIGNTVTKTSDITNDGADGTSTYVEHDEIGTVATSNDYNDLDNLPSIPTVPTQTSDLTNDGADGTSTFVENDEIATVATSGDYDDLSNRPIYFGYAASDELSDLEVQENAIRFRMPFSMTLTDVIATVNEGCFGSKIICDVEQEGVSVFSTLLTIDQEGRATGTVELTGGASGSVDGITVDGVEIMSGAEAFDTDLDTTAANVAANITAHTSAPEYTASAVGSVITITSVFAGSDVNGYAVVSTATTITTTDTNLSGGTSSETSNVASVPAVISNPNLTEDMEISANIDQVGSTQAGKGLKIWFIGTKV